MTTPNDQQQQIELLKKHIELLEQRLLRLETRAQEARAEPAVSRALFEPGSKPSNGHAPRPELAVASPPPAARSAPREPSSSPSGGEQL